MRTKLVFFFISYKKVYYESNKNINNMQYQNRKKKLLKKC